MAHQFIFTMQAVGKVHPPNKIVLRDIWLSFLPGAKIGVLGANGAGKSSLLRIMAGVDTDHLGEAAPAKGIRIGSGTRSWCDEDDWEPDLRARDPAARAAGRSLVLREEAVTPRSSTPPPL